MNFGTFFDQCTVCRKLLHEPTGRAIFQALISIFWKKTKRERESISCRRIANGGKQKKSIGRRKTNKVERNSVLKCIEQSVGQCYCRQAIRQVFDLISGPIRRPRTGEYPEDDLRTFGGGSDSLCTANFRGSIFRRKLIRLENYFSKAIARRCFVVGVIRVDHNWAMMTSDRKG